MKKGLGRGLKSLMPEESEFTSESNGSSQDAQGEITELRLFEVEPNKNQPRKQFDEEKIDALADSIRENGVIQPIIVTKSDTGYTIVAGERRWRAAKKAGISTIPAIIREYSDAESAEIALIENLQREDLNPVEEALGYSSLMSDFNLTQESVAKKVGKSRSAVANSLRLLGLDDQIKEYLVHGELSGGHAKALLYLDDADKRVELAETIIEKGLNVRQAEAMAKKIKQQSEKPPVYETDKTDDSAYRIQLEKIQEELSSRFGTKVKITPGTKKSKIELEYYNNEDLERLLAMLS